ncbi:ribonuclease H-like domain-containing protein [Tanacetum coccineum]
MAFMSSSNNNTSSSNEAINAAYGVTTTSTQVNTAYFTNIDNLSDAVICSFFASQPNRRKHTVNGNETIGFDKSKVDCYNCHKRGHFARKSLVSCDGLGGYDLSDQAEEGPNYALMAYSSSSFDSEIVDNCKKSLGYEKYNTVPPPYTGNFMPPTPDLSFTGLDEFVYKHVVENIKSDKEVSKVVRKSDDSPIIEDWVSDSDEENVSQTKTEKKTVKPSIAKIEFIKPKQQQKLLGKLLNKLSNIGKTLTVQEAIKEIGTI